MATTSRMLTLLSLLQARRDWPARVLAERLEISDRTVRRDVDRLRALGYRVLAIKGPDGGYRLDAGSELPPLLFDDEQAVALAVALRSAAGAGLDEPAARALATVRQVMPARLRHRIDALEITGMAAPGAVRVDTGTLIALGEATRAHDIVRFDYGGDEPRRVEPHHLVTRSGRWYLVGWDLERDDWRVFRVDRLGLRSHAGPRFTPRMLPGGDVAAFLSARFTGSVGGDAWPCEGEVILHAPAREVAPYIGDGLVEELSENRSRVILGAWSWVGLAASIARFDADIDVVGPPELVAAFATLAARFESAAR